MHTSHDQLFHHHFLKKPLNQLYFSMAIRSFGISLVALFIPVYLHISLGYSLNETLFYFIFGALVFSLFTPVAAIISSKIGLKHVILLSVPFYIVNLYLLFLVKTYAIPLWLIGAIGGAGSALFWFGFHYIFFLLSDKKHRGQEVGIRLSTSLVAAFVGPLLGGFLIQQFGFQSVFLLAGITLFVSALFLLLSPDVKTNYHFKFKSIFDIHSTKLALFFMSRGMLDTGASVIWPLFLFFILQNYTSLGFTQSLVTIGSIVLIFLSGRWSDHQSKKKIVRFFSFIEAFNWGLRSLITTVTHVLGVTILGAFTSGIMSPAIVAVEYDAGIYKKDRAAFFVHREFFMSLGRIILLLVLFKTQDFKLAVALMAALQFFVYIL